MSAPTDCIVELGRGDRVQLRGRPDFRGTVDEVFIAHSVPWVVLFWDADRDGGPYEDEVEVSMLERVA